MVDSMPPSRDHRRGPSPMSRWEQFEASNCRLVFAIVVGLLSMLILLIVQSLTPALAKTFFAGFWLVVSPWLSGISGVILLVCTAVVAWHLYLLYVVQREKFHQAQLLEEDLASRKQTNRLIQEARANGDNIKLSLGDDGRLKTLEIIRSETLLEQARIQQAGRARVTEVKQSQIAQRSESHGETVPPLKQQKKISGPAIMRETEIIVPHAYDLASVMHRLPESELFLGIDHHDRWLCCDPTDQLCHGALNAVTGRGKTILVRGLETQLLKMGCEVVHADIKFTLIDEYGNDYKPLAKALLQQGEIDMGNETYLPHLLLRDDHICHMIMWLAGPELRRRLAMYAQGDHSYGVFYLFLEELAYLLSKYKWLGPLIADLLVVGRSLGIKVVAVAQNFQVQNLKINSGMRENFESAWYLGGDWNSGAAILDMAETELKELIAQHNIKLGKGVSMFRNNAVAYEPVVLRAGMASNDFVYYFLGRADGLLLPEHILPTADSVAPDKSPLRGDGKQGQGGYSGRNTPLEMPQNGLETPIGMVIDADVYAQKSGVERPVEQPQAAQGNATKYRLTDEQARMFCFIYPDIETNKDEALKRVGANTAYRAHANELILQYNLMAKKQKSS